MQGITVGFISTHDATSIAAKFLVIKNYPSNPDIFLANATFNSDAFTEVQDWYVSSALKLLFVRCRTGRSRMRTLIYCERLGLIKYANWVGQRERSVAKASD
jgi:hypothetical protein